MSVTVRRLTQDDLLNLQHCNLFCLPENYQFKYYLLHILCWPHMPQVAVDDTGKVCGYVLAKMDDEPDQLLPKAHITSISVLRSHRMLGVATKLVRATQREMRHTYLAHVVSLHVRASNTAAIHLYQNSCGFRVVEVEPKYYADGEDAFEMHCFLHRWIDHGALVRPDGTLDSREATRATSGRLIWPQAYVEARNRKVIRGEPVPPPLLADLPKMDGLPQPEPIDAPEAEGEGKSAGRRRRKR
eukprot:TRINITY_DN1329_c0_g2_i2.p1 TRINITY_DN1329_c0_g2~~TRINITY_DN1329_c0_g2_i2.p1  ORF type:complete len:243 (+),score=33.29 TRINITY_DN1329_c0_g2_i2:316-1044(+)